MDLERKKNDTPQCDQLMTYHAATARYPRWLTFEKKQEDAEGVFVSVAKDAGGSRYRQTLDDSVVEQVHQAQ